VDLGIFQKWVDSEIGDGSPPWNHGLRDFDPQNLKQNVKLLYKF